MIKKILEKLNEWGAIFFVGLLFIGIILYFQGYFNQLQIIWIAIFIIISWLIYIYRYLEEEAINKEKISNNNSQ
jgi:uncharacterized membrane protein YjjP (DUF1212 family)